MSDVLKQIEHLSPKRLALLAVEQQLRLEQLERERDERIAIIGMGCRLPGDASSPEAYWRLLVEERDAVSEVPASRWNIDDYFDPNPDTPGKMATRWGGFVSDIDRFDATFFGISRREAISLDPQQRMLLEVTWEALEHAGCNPHALGGTATGVFVGLCTSDYHSMLLGRGQGALDAYVATGTAHSVAAGRVAYVLGLHGPNVAVDTACSSSLVAVHLACQSLLSGECGTALAGGVNAVLSPEITIALSKGRMMSPDGRCKAFDAHADGFVRGEGCGVVVLKRLSDALRDGDRVLAVIRGSAVNQDGRSSGITAPNGAAQEAVIRAALAKARVQASAVDYVEAHGTGTSLGDPIEAHALGGVLREGRSADNPLVVGSVKTNLGHLESAAGVAGLIKIVLSLQHEFIPAHLHFEALNPHIDWQGLPVEIPTRGKRWPRSARPRIAGLSSFGFSGTNAHLVVEEAPAAVERSAPILPDRAVTVLTVSARTPAALDTLIDRYASYVATHPEQRVGEIALTANTGRAPLAERAAFVATSRGALQAALSKRPAAIRRQAGHTGRVAFLFTGQGAQFAGMAKQLYDTEPVFHAAFDQCAGLLRDQLDTPLHSLLWGADSVRMEEDTTYTQPAMFALQWSLAELWRSWGVQPAVVLGHSVGEYAAACVAGVFSLADGLRLIATRGRLTGGLARGIGAMAAVMAPRAIVERAVRQRGSSVGIAAINGPEHVVIAGSLAEVASIEDECRDAGFRVERLRVSHAFHSPLMAPAEDAFEAAAAAIAMSAPRVALVSSVTGLLAGAELQTPGYWRRQVREAVQFEAAMAALADQDCDAFIEIGPGSTLLGLGQPLIGRDEQVWSPSIRRSRQDCEQTAETLAALWTCGVQVDWLAYDAKRSQRGVALPTYPFERQRYWPDVAATAAAGRAPVERNGRRADSAIPIYDQTVDVASSPWIAQHQVAGSPVMPGAGLIEAALAAGTDALGCADVCLENLNFVAPVRFDQGNEVRQVQTIVHAGDPGRASFEIFSRNAATRAGDWLLHASGTMSTRAERSGGNLDEIRRRVQAASDVDAFYRELASSRIDLGPACRGLRRLWTTAGEALAEVQLAESDRDGASVDVALLDSCLQVLGAAALASETPSGRTTRVLSRIGRLQLFAPLTGAVLVHARFADAGGSASGEVTIFDPGGSIVGIAEDLWLSAVSLAPAAPKDWFYALEWEPRDLDADATSATGAIVADESLVAGLRTEAARLADIHGLGRYATVRPALDRIVSSFIERALSQLHGGYSRGAIVSTADIASRGGVVTRQMRLLARMLQILEEDGLLLRAGEDWLVQGTGPDADPAAVCAQYEQEFPEFGAEITLTRRCGENLAAVLRGDVDPLQLLAPGGSFDTLERLYIESPSAKTFNVTARCALASALAQHSPDRLVRILEIGAGTGGTTTYLAQALESRRVEYVVTDVSPAFVNRAQQRFGRVPGMRFGPLDIERSPAEQGYELGSFDIVVAANVLHATSDIRQTIQHARQLLRPGGLLLALEGTGAERWVDLTFGMTEGWWKFSDDVRDDYPLMSTDTWRRLLQTEHFSRTACVLPAPDSRQVLLLASADESPLTAQQSSCLIVGGAHAEATALAERLAGSRVDVTVAADAAAARVAGDQRTFDHTVVMSADATTAGDNCCATALDVMHRLAVPSARGRLWLVTRGAQAVNGVASSSPDEAAIWGLGRTFSLEHPDRWGGLIDVAADSGAADVAEAVTLEMMHSADEDQTAYQGRKRFVPRLTRTTAPVGAPSFKRDASYVVTGGLGRLGLHVAQWLATHGARQLVLVSRTPLDAASPAGVRSRAIEVIEGLEAQGVSVTTVAADVSTDAGIQVLRAAVANQTVRGIVHAAAVFDSSPLADLTPARLHDVLRPKRGGCRRLAALVPADQLDFLALFSSTTSLLGVRDLGAYAAANQVLDSLASQLRASGYPAIAVNWGTWNQMDSVPEDVQRSYVRSGLRPMDASTALVALGAALSAPASQMVIADIDWSVLKPLYESRRRRPMLERLSSIAAEDRAVPAAAHRAEGLAELLARTDASERIEVLVDAVRDEAGAVLSLTPDEVDAAAGLFELGMDSLMSVELKRRLEQRAGCALPSTLTFNYPSVRALAGFLLEQLGNDVPVLKPVAANAVETMPVDDGREDLCEDELASLLERALDA